MYSKVRKYINQQIKDIYGKDLNEWKDGFNTDNIPRTELKKGAYHIFYEPSSIVQGQSSVDTSLSVDVTLAFSAKNKVQDKYDEAMDKASNLMRSCASQSAMYSFRDTDNYPIQQVSPTGITATPFDTNDNSFKIVISMDVLINETIC